MKKTINRYHHRLSDSNKLMREVQLQKEMIVKDFKHLKKDYNKVSSSTKHRIVAQIKNITNHEDAAFIMNKIDLLFPGASSGILAKHKKVIDDYNKKEMAKERGSTYYVMIQALDFYAHKFTDEQVQNVRNMVNNDLNVSSNSGIS